MGYCWADEKFYEGITSGVWIFGFDGFEEDAVMSVERFWGWAVGNALEGKESEAFEGYLA